ncbi:hypothetical protein LY76DRAFT_432034 [Colletotrichum caudatum]|nr:hypothetical protein LY76DRAFT_432034 [Colletotrichum caudatum]
MMPSEYAESQPSGYDGPPRNGTSTTNHGAGGMFPLCQPALYLYAELKGTERAAYVRSLPQQTVQSRWGKRRKQQQYVSDIPTCLSGLGLGLDPTRDCLLPHGYGDTKTVLPGTQSKASLVTKQVTTSRNQGGAGSHIRLCLPACPPACPSILPRR